MPPNTLDLVQRPRSTEIYRAPSFVALVILALISTGCISDPGGTTRRIGATTEAGEVTLHVEGCDQFDDRVTEIQISDGSDLWARPEWKLKTERSAKKFSVNLAAPKGWQVEGDRESLASITFPFAVHLVTPDGTVGDTILHSAPPPSTVRVTGADLSGETDENLTLEDFRAAAVVDCQELLQ